MVLMSWFARPCGAAPQAASPVEAFWQCFAQEEARLRRALILASRGAKRLEETKARIVEDLQKIDPALSLDVGWAKDNVFELVLSAGGRRDLFPTVSAVAAAAPQLPRWRVIAFRPPRRSGLELCVRGRTLGAEGLWFRLEPRRDQADLGLYVAGLTAEEREPLKGAAASLLDAALGEYAAATRIGAIDLKGLPEDPAAAGLHPITELRAEFDAIFPEARP